MTDTPTANPPSAIYASLAAIMDGITAIGKERQNQEQHYKFRGIEDCYNALHPLLADNKVIVRQVVTKMERDQRPTKSGGMMNITIITADHHFTSLIDGSVLTVTTVGEGMDVADKATNKAMSAAMKYALIPTFAIPTVGVIEDGDTTTPEATTTTGVGQKPAAAPPPKQQPPKAAPAQAADPNVYHVKEVREVASGSTGKGPWALTAVTTVEGPQFKTFDMTFASIAGEALEGNMPVRITYREEPNKKNPKYTDNIIESIAPVTDAPAQGDQPEQVTETRTLISEVQTRPDSATKELLYVLICQNGRYGTTDARFGQQAQKLAGTGAEVIISHVADRRGRRVTKIDDQPSLAGASDYEPTTPEEDIPF